VRHNLKIQTAPFCTCVCLHACRALVLQVTMLLSYPPTTRCDSSGSFFRYV
jgi:hypothetical protein